MSFNHWVLIACAEIRLTFISGAGPAELLARKTGPLFPLIRSWKSDPPSSHRLPSSSRDLCLMVTTPHITCIRTWHMSLHAKMNYALRLVMQPPCPLAGWENAMLGSLGTQHGTCLWLDPAAKQNRCPWTTEQLASRSSRWQMLG